MEKEDVKIPTEENQDSLVNTDNLCCEASNSCCGISGSQATSVSQNVQPLELKTRNPNKLHVDIFVPLNACECVWSQFMNLVFSVLTPYMKHIKFETKNLDSDEARRLNLTGNCVVIDGKKKFITSFALKKELPELLREKGLL